MAASALGSRQSFDPWSYSFACETALQILKSEAQSDRAASEKHILKERGVCYSEITFSVMPAL